jgi:hypothetical protein
MPFAGFGRRNGKIASTKNVREILASLPAGW